MLETKTILHILRNPYGHTEAGKREARLDAADYIEQLEKANLDYLKASVERGEAHIHLNDKAACEGACMDSEGTN